jgi:outer membrane usher protein
VRDRNTLVAALALLVMLVASAFTSARAQSLPPADQTWRPLWVAVELNGIPQPQTVLVMDVDGQLWAARDALDAWRVARIDTFTPREFLGRSYYSLRQIGSSGDLQWRFDQRQQLLVVTASAAILSETRLSGAQEPAGSRMELPPGGFLNYDVSAAAYQDERWQNGFFEGGFFRGPVTATQTLAALDTGEGLTARRLDSTVEIDFPQIRATLVLGDAISTAGEWARAVRFAGAQWATNFQTRPDLLTFPLPTLAGDVAVPSTIDIFIDGALRTSRALPAGPFTISELPAVAGNGQITARVRDLFGHEHVIAQSFYASPQLLRPGLSAYALEVGAQRKAYARDDDGYAQPFAQATWKRGIDDSTTTELRMETLLDQTTLGASLIRRIGNLGVLQAAMVGSRADGGGGLLTQLGFEYAGRRFNAGGQTRIAQAQFRQLGRADDASAPRIELTAHAGYHSHRLGSFAGAYVRRAGLQGRALDLASASYARELGRWGFLSVTLLQDLHSSARPSVLASVTQLIGGNRSAQYAANVDDRGSRLRMELRKNRPAGPGVGYQVAAERGAYDRFAGEAVWAGSTGVLSGEIDHRGETTGVRATASGGVGLLGGELYAMPRIDSNFAVVEVSQMADVPVYLEAQQVGRTDARGRTAITGLRPYEVNRISIDPADLPLAATVDGDRVDAVPYGRGGVLVRMPVQISGGVLIRLLYDAVTPVPVGARVTFGGRQYPVATDGNVYIDRVDHAGVAHARWAGGECEATLDLATLTINASAVDVICKSSRSLRTSTGDAQ